MFNVAKFREMILLIAKRSENDPAFGATKLNKLLFFADFAAVRRFGKPISGAHYQKLERGRAPRELVPVRDEMLATGSLVELTREYLGKRQSRFVPKDEPTYSNLTANEVALIDEIIDQYRDSNASDISDVSHRFIGWRIADIGEEIPIETELLQPRQSSARDYERGRILDAEYQWTADHAK